MSDIVYKARLLIASTRAALMNGCLHYSMRDGRLLPTEIAIITCLRDEKQIRVDERNKVPITTAEAELVKILPKETLQ